MKKRILITGANGFLGSRLSGYFKKMDGYETLGVSHRELEVSDSLAVSAFVKAIRPDYVLHCAGVELPIWPRHADSPEAGWYS